MVEPRPEFDEFKRQLEELFGQPLNSQAEEAARDFWDSWDSFAVEIDRRGLSVHVDALRLGLNFPEYKRYHVWKGAGTLALIAGAVTVWFFQTMGVGLLVVGVAGQLIGNWRRFNDAKQFAERLMKDATLQPRAGGYAGLCSNYVAGIVRLVTAAGNAQWPQHPSNAVTGARTRIAT